MLFYWHIYYIYRLRVASYEVVNRKAFPNPCRQSPVNLLFACWWNICECFPHSTCCSLKCLRYFSFKIIVHNNRETVFVLLLLCSSCVSYLYILLFQILILTAQCALLQTLPALSVCRHEYSFVRNWEIFCTISKNKKSFYREFSAKMFWMKWFNCKCFIWQIWIGKKVVFHMLKGFFIFAIFMDKTL